MNIRYLTLLAVLALWTGGRELARADVEILNWDIEEFENRETATCLYGRVTVLLTIQGMYYSAANFEKGDTGLQHLEQDLHTAYISIADTSARLPAKITRTDSPARVDRFAPAGEGAHVNVDASWKAGKTYEFFLMKQPGKDGKSTDTSYSIVGPSGKWRHVATINAPNGPKHEGETFHNGFSSSMEKVDAAADLNKPKIVLYDLWLGPNIDGLKRLTRTGGESGAGRWGKLHDQYFLAEGSPEQIKAAFGKLEHEQGVPVFGTDGEELASLPEKPLPIETISELKKLH